MCRLGMVDVEMPTNDSAMRSCRTLSGSHWNVHRQACECVVVVLVVVDKVAVSLVAASQAVAEGSLQPGPSTRLQELLVLSRQLGPSTQLQATARLLGPSTQQPAAADPDEQQDVEQAPARTGQTHRDQELREKLRW